MGIHYSKTVLVQLAV